MFPLLAFFPVCFLFTSLGIIVMLVLVFRVGAGSGAMDTSPAETPSGPKPPYWIAPVVLMFALVALLMLSFVTAG